MSTPNSLPARDLADVLATDRDRLLEAARRALADVGEDVDRALNLLDSPDGPRVRTNVSGAILSASRFADAERLLATFWTVAGYAANAEEAAREEVAEVLAERYGEDPSVVLLVSRVAEDYLSAGFEDVRYSLESDGTVLSVAPRESRLGVVFVAPGDSPGDGPEGWRLVRDFRTAGPATVPDGYSGPADPASEAAVRVAADLYFGAAPAEVSADFEDEGEGNLLRVSLPDAAEGSVLLSRPEDADAAREGRWTLEEDSRPYGTWKLPEPGTYVYPAAIGWEEASESPESVGEVVSVLRGVSPEDLAEEELEESDLDSDSLAAARASREDLFAVVEFSVTYAPGSRPVRELHPLAVREIRPVPPVEA